MHRFFFYLLVLLLPTQLGLHVWPEWSMVLGRRIDYLSPTLFLTDILIVLIIIFWMLSVNPKKLIELVKQYEKPLFVLLIVAAINFWFSQNQMATIFGWLKWFEYGLLFLYIKTTSPSFSRLYTSLSIAVYFSISLGMLQSILGGSIGGLFWLVGERSFTISTPNIAKAVICLPSLSCFEYLRPYATFPHPNVFAGFLSFYLTLSFVRLSRSSLRHILPFVTLIITLSRSSWFALIFTLVVTRFNRHWLLPLSFTMLFLIFLLPFPAFDRESVDVRVALNQAAISMITSYPLIGVGLKNFLTLLPDFLPLRTIYFLQPVHNIYLLLLSEIGILIWGMLLLVAIRFRSRLITNWPLIVLLCIGFFDHYLLTLQQGQLLLTLAFALPYVARKEYS